MTLYTFQEFPYYTEITGFKKTNPQQTTQYLQNNRKTNPQNIWIQFFNANLIATHQHLYFATLNALHAFKNHTNISKNIAIETLLYASTQHQIQKAIQTIGLKPNTTDIAITITSKNPQQIKTTLNDLSTHLQTNPCNTILKLTPKKINNIKQTFNITQTTIETTTKNKETNPTLINLIIEKIALLNTKL